MSSRQAAGSARALVALIGQNRQDERAGRISVTEYRARQARYWDQADRLGLREQVMALLWTKHIDRNRAGNPARARARADLLEARDALRALRGERKAKRAAFRADDAIERKRRVEAAIERLAVELTNIRAEFRRRREELAAEQRMEIANARARHRMNLAAIRTEIRGRDAQRWAKLEELRRAVAEKRAILAGMRSESAIRRGKRAAEPYQEALHIAENAIEAQRPDLLIAWRYFRKARGSSSRLRDWYRAGKARLRKDAPRSAAGETIGVAFMEYADENPDLLAHAYEQEQSALERMQRPDEDDWRNMPIRDEAVEGVPF